MAFSCTTQSEDRLAELFLNQATPAAVAMFGPIRHGPYDDAERPSPEGRLRALEARVEALESGTAYLDASTRLLSQNLTEHREEWSWWRIFFDRLWRVFGYELY